MQQSVLTDDANGGVISGPNLKQTVIVPDLHDNELEKVRKQKYFDSQVMQMFGSVLNRKSIHPNQLNSINEENSETKDNIINSTDEPITGMGNSPFDEINNIPLSESVKKI